MAGSTKRRVSPGVESVRQRVEQWRVSRGSRGPMPDDVWDAAVAVAAVDGVGPVARIARLDYYALKRRLQKFKERSPRDRFVEIVPIGALAPPGGECVIELERPDGARMRLRVPDAAHVTELAAAFLRGRP